MRFSLIDRITELHSGTSITAVKNVTMSEEYLMDHFPLYPVLPGVFMLEAMTQAAAWLVRHDEDFANSVVVLKEARNLKYADFVQPGNTLTVTAALSKLDNRTAKFSARGSVGNRQHVSAKLTLERYNLSDQNPEDRPLDDIARQDLRELFLRLYQPRAETET